MMPPESVQYQTLIADLALYGENKLTVTGYNVNFDIRFIKAFFCRNKPLHFGGAYHDYFDAMPCDILQFAQGIRVAGLIDLPSLKLGLLCDYLGIDTQNMHNAAVDIKNTQKAFHQLLTLGNQKTD